MIEIKKRLIIGKIENGSKFREAIEELYFKVFTDYPWYDEIEPEDSIMICKKYFEDDKYTILGGLEEGKLLGFAVVKDIEYSNIPEATNKFNKYNLEGLYIEETGVDPDYQRQGLGREVLEYVMEKYPDRFIYFTTNNSKDSPMGKLTQSLGFEFVTDENNNVKVFSQDNDKGSPIERCSLFYNNVRSKEKAEKQNTDEER